LNNYILWEDKMEDEQQDQVNITMKFRLPDFLANSNEKIKDFAVHILGPDWDTEISETTLVTLFKLKITDSKLTAMNSKFFCSKCSELILNKEELYNHVFLHHRDLIKQAEFGLPSTDKIRSQILNFFGDSPAGQKFLTLYSSLNEQLTDRFKGMSVRAVEFFRQNDPQNTVTLDIQTLPDFDDVAVQILDRQENQRRPE
jgi:hypothetical protein